MGWLDGWSYRKAIPIANSGPEALNYVMGYGSGRLILHYGSGTDDYDDFYLDSLCKTNFGDIRFTSDDGETLLSFWMEELKTSDWSSYLIKIPSIPNGGTSIYVYYGNAAVATTSTTATFLQFEGFESGDFGLFTSALGTIALTVSSTAPKHGSYCIRDNDTSATTFGIRYTANGTFWSANKTIIEFWMKGSGLTPLGIYNWMNSGTKRKTICGIMTDHQLFYNDSVSNIALGAATDDYYYKFSLKLNLDDLIWGLEILDQNLNLLYQVTDITMRNDSVSYRDIAFGTGNADVGDGKADSFRSMPYVLPEPTWGEAYPPLWRHAEDIQSTVVLAPPYNVDLGKCHVLISDDFSISGKIITVESDLPEGLLDGLRLILVDAEVEQEQITTILSNTRREIFIADTPDPSYTFGRIRIVTTWNKPIYRVIIDTQEFSPEAVVPLVTVREFKKYWRESATVGGLNEEDWIELTTYGLSPAQRYVEFKFEAYGEACYLSDVQQISLFRRV